MTEVTEAKIEQIEDADANKALRKKQGGFTLLEIVIALAVLAVIIGVLASGLFQSQEDAKLQAARTQIMKDFPSAIMRVVSISNSCTKVDKARLIARGLPDKTVWGTDWTVSGATSSDITIVYPTEAKDQVSLKDLVDGIPTYTNDSSSNVSTITTSGKNITVAYRCN